MRGPQCYPSPFTVPLLMLMVMWGLLIKSTHQNLSIIAMATRTIMTEIVMVTYS